MNMGGSISFQLIDIFNIIDNGKLSEEQKRTEIIEYQKSLTQEGKGIPIGPEGTDGECMKNGYFVFGDIDVMSYEDLLRTKEYVDNYLTSFTCEAEMKMKALIDKYDKDTHKINYRFELVDKVYNYVMKNEKAMRGHTLVWHNHEPDALDDYIKDHYVGNMKEDEKNNPEEFRSKRKELTKLFLAEYIKAVGERYPNCYCWDVLNEIVPDVHTPEATEEEKLDGLRHSKWFEYLGKDFYIEVLEIARENLPDGTKLFYNDFGEQNLEKRKAIIQVIENIKTYEEQTGKILLDGIGLQSHYDINMTEQQIEEIYRDFSATGKEIEITEMDVSPGYDRNTGYHLPYDPKNMPKYEKIWNKVFSCAQKYGVKVFTGWGISDALIWHKNTGCTMISDDGSIKGFAKEFFDSNHTKNTITENFGLEAIGQIYDKVPTKQRETGMQKLNQAIIESEMIQESSEVSLYDN